MVKTTALFLILVLAAGNTAFAQEPSASQIERSREQINKEELLKQKLNQEPEQFVRIVNVTGSSLKADKIKEITLAFEKRWLSKSDIEQMIELFKNAYKQLNKPEPKISYQLQKHLLEINIKE